MMPNQLNFIPINAIKEAMSNNSAAKNAACNTPISINPAEGINQCKISIKPRKAIKAIGIAIKSAQNLKKSLNFSIIFIFVL